LVSVNCFVAFAMEQYHKIDGRRSFYSDKLGLGEKRLNQILKDFLLDFLRGVVFLLETIKKAI